MSPGIANKIKFNPPLSSLDKTLGPKREKLMASCAMGSTIKAFLSYKTPFWREQYVWKLAHTLDQCLIDDICMRLRASEE